MAQSGFTPISLYFSATSAAVPSAGNLVAGELALNTNDGKLYYKNSSGVVTLLAGATSGPAGGSTTQVQYNNAGVLAGITGATTNGTALTLVAPVLGTPASGTVTNLTGTASININGTVGATTPAAGAFTTLSATGDATITKSLPALVLQPNAGTYSNIQMRGNATLALGLDILAGAQAAYFSADTLTFRNAAQSANYGVFSSTGLAVTGTLTSTLDATIYGVTVGRGAGAVSTNTAVGASALAANTSGAFNTAGGANALAANTSGAASTAFGYNALTLSTGDANNAFGRLAMPATTSGTNNAAFGNNTLQANTTGSYNVALGANALNANTTASNNTAVGYQAGYNNTTATDNAYFGYLAGYSSTTNGGNTGIGNLSLQDNTGYQNTALGSQALLNNTSGFNNTGLGKDALASNTTASNNTAVGYQAGYTNTTANSSAFFGYQAGYTSNADNGTFIGFYAGQASTGAANTFIGSGAGYLVSSGAKNTILGGYNGNQGSLDIRTASNYIVLSDGDGNPLISTNSTRSVALNGAVPQTGTGITFPATQSASSNANTLDDYEEGTWTASDGSGAGRTFTTLLCSYVKIGSQVTVNAFFTVDISASTAGFRVNGLPFSAAASTQTIGTFNSSSGNAGTSYISASVNYVNVATPATYNTALLNSQISNCGVAFTLTYFV